MKRGRGSLLSVSLLLLCVIVCANAQNSTFASPLNTASNTSYDICRRGDSTEVCTRCLASDTIILKRQLCDGIFNCPDLSDECLCSNGIHSSTCREVFFDNSTSQTAAGNAKAPEIDLASVCDSVGVVHCEIKRSLTAGDYFCPHTHELARYCDGIQECWGQLDECQPECLRRRPENNAVCQKLPCADYFCQRSYQCADNATLDLWRRCDLVEDCAGGEDERSCSSNSHFYCSGGVPTFIASHKLNDGRRDCADGSDELDNSLEGRVTPVERFFYSVLIVLFWAFAALTTAANCHVLLGHFRKLVLGPDRRNLDELPAINISLLAHLATADLLMGVSMITQAVHNFNFGVYSFAIFHDRTCKAISVMMVVSTQTGMNLLVLLSAVRCYTTYKRRHTRLITFRRVQLLAGLSWLTAATFAALPLALKRYTDWYFLQKSPFFSAGHTEEQPLAAYGRMSNAILRFHRRNQSIAMRDGAYELTPADDARFDADWTVRVVGTTGFHNQVDSCFPNIFLSKWPFRGLSLALIGYNLAAIVVITLCYVGVYVNTRRSSSSLADGVDSESARRHEQRESTLRSKIGVIVATNLVCWLPIIAFAGYVFASGDDSLDHRLVFCVQRVANTLLLPANSCANPFIYANFKKELAKPLSAITVRMGALVSAAPAEAAAGSRRNSTVILSEDGSSATEATDVAEILSLERPVSGN